MILSWFEMPEKDRPDESIWLDDEALTNHFESLNSRNSSGGGQEWEPVPQADIGNDLVQDLFGGRR